MIRWWNEGRYERECAAFDVEQPLSREVWESLQRQDAWLSLALQPMPFEQAAPAEDDFAIVVCYPNAKREGMVWSASAMAASL